MKNNKILIIIPFHNVEECIEEAIEGILQQKYQNFHLVLVNDLSTDGTLEIVNRYKNNSKITILHNSENRGAYYSVNKALYHFKDEEWDYFHFHGSDDVSDLTRFEKINEFLNNHPNTLGLKTTYIRVWHSTKEINYENGKPHITTSEGCAFFSRKSFNYIGYYDNTRFSGDTDYWWRLTNFINSNPQYNFELNDHTEPLIIGYLREKKSNLTLQYPISGGDRQEYYNKSRNDIFQMSKTGNFYREKFD